MLGGGGHSEALMCGVQADYRGPRDTGSPPGPLGALWWVIHINMTHDNPDSTNLLFLIVSDWLLHHSHAGLIAGSGALPRLATRRPVQTLDV